MSTQTKLKLSKTMNPKNLSIGVTLLIISVMSITGWAQVSAMDVNAVSTEESVVDGRAEFIAFEKDSDVKDGLRILAALYSKNIVPSPKVDGMLGFTKLRDVTFEEAMDAVLGTNFIYEEEENIIKVYTQEEHAQMMADVNRMIYKVFPLYYISAAEAAKLITSVLSANASVQSSTPADNILPTGESISGGSAGGDSMALNDHLVIKDYPENLTQVEALLTQLDVRPLQVLVEAVIMEVGLDDETQLGVNWDSVSGGGGISITKSGASSSVFTSTALDPTGGLKIGISSDNINAIVQAINTTSETTLMARTKVQAVNKQLGQLYIGKKIGYLDTTNQNESGSTTQSVAFLETGTKLTFRPYIGNDGYIRMDIHPKVSDGEFKTNNIPDETSTEVATNIIVKDGQTVVIGGLFKDDVDTAIKQVPVLGSVPVVGALFRHKKDIVKRSEIVVIMTPHILDVPDSGAGAMALADAKRAQDAAWNGVQLLSRAKEAELFYTKAARLYLEGKNEEAMKEVRAALHLRPTYLQATRLKERILSETDAEKMQRMDRIVREEMDWQEKASWKQ